MTALPTIQDDEHQGQLSLGVWKKLLGYARPYRWHLLVVAVIAGTLAHCEVRVTLMTKRVIDDVQANGTQADLVAYAIEYAVLVALIAVQIALFIRICGRVSTGISHNIRRDGFNHLQDLSFSFYDRRPAGWLVARLTSDCDRLSRTLAWGSLDIVWGFCMVVHVAITMLWMSPTLGLIVLSILPPTVWVSLVFQKRILNASRAVRKQNSTLTAAYSECITGVRTTKTLVREGENLREFEGKTDAMYAESVRAAVLSATYFPVVMTLGGAGAGLAIWFGGLDAMRGAITVGSLIVFVTFARQLFFPILEMARVLADLQNTQAAAERIFGLIDTVPDVKDTPEALAAIERNGREGPAPGAAVDGLADRIAEVRFRNVSFHYEPGEPVLTDFNLTVTAGQTVALVGPTGGGKSTIVSLLCRFYEPTAGEILLDGVEYRRRSLHWLQSSLGIVLQQPHLFSGTIRENIRYGRLDASDPEVIRAAELVCAHGFIAELEDGYDTEVGEGGGKLSTGQKQLVSFARAVLADPRIFVMDEATSSVDTETERHIQQGLAAVLEGRMSFIIAHRLSTIRSADVILVIDGGRIVEQGTHADLIALRGRYYELYTHQFTEDKTADFFRHTDEDPAP